MTIESAPIDTLTPDPANVRTHPGRNLAAIRASLLRFGQQKPIVVDSRGVVRAGNGTLAAARSLGWTHVQVVRTDLAAGEATAYAIADNRTADLAGWDDAALWAQLSALQEEGVDPDDLGFTEKDLARLAGDDPTEAAATLAEQWLVVVTCRDEADQAAFLAEMESAGRSCKAVIA